MSNIDEKIILTEKQQEINPGKEETLKIEQTTEDVKILVEETLGFPDIFKPNSEWYDTVSVEIETSSFEEENNENTTIIDPTTIFEIDIEAIEKSLEEDSKPKPPKEIDMSDVPIIIDPDLNKDKLNWREGKDDNKTIIPSKDASLEELLKHGLSNGLLDDFEAELNNTGLILVNSEVDEIKEIKEKIILDPYPNSILGGELSFYVNHFNKIFEGSKNDTIEQLITGYETIILYILEKFDILENNEDEIKQKINNKKILYKKLNFIEKSTKIYPRLKPEERKELEDRYYFYENNYVYLFINQYEIEINKLQEEINKLQEEIKIFRGRLGPLYEHIEQQDDETKLSNIKKIIENVNKLLQKKEEENIENLNKIIKLYAKVLLYILDNFSIGSSNHKQKNKNMIILAESLGDYELCDELEKEETLEKTYFIPTDINRLKEYYKNYSNQYVKYKKLLFEEKKNIDSDDKKRQSFEKKLNEIEKKLLRELDKKLVEAFILQDVKEKEMDKKLSKYRSANMSDKTIIIPKK